MPEPTPSGKIPGKVGVWPMVKIWEKELNPPETRERIDGNCSHLVGLQDEISGEGKLSQDRKKPFRSWQTQEFSKKFPREFSNAIGEDAFLD